MQAHRSSFKYCQILSSWKRRRTLHQVSPWNPCFNSPAVTMDTQLSNPFVMWQNTRLPCLLLLWNTSIWSPLISLYLAGHRCTTSRFFQLPASKEAARPLCSCSPIFDPPLPLQKPWARGSRLLTQDGNSIALCFVSDNQSISYELSGMHSPAGPTATAERSGSRAASASGLNLEQLSLANL